MDRRTLAAHILQALALAQSEGRLENLDTLVEKLRVRRKDVRGAVTALHREGMLDALRLRLTLAGFAIGSALRSERLPALRTSALAVAAVA